MQNFHPKPISFYAKELKDALPPEAYQLAPYKLIPMFFHAGLIFLNIYLAGYFGTVLAMIVCAILGGLSIACIFLFSHELSHGTIVRKEPYLYILQNFFWAFSGIPPTMWKRVHNASHHVHMNTYDDPDRKTFKSEAGFLNNLYNLFIYPNKTLRYSLTVGFAMMFYSTKHILAVFYPEGSRPAIVTYRPKYLKKDRIKVFFELAYLLAFWIGVWVYLGFLTGIIFSLISWAIYSASVILFIITQHQRDPVFIKTADPLLTTTSVIVPKWLDWLIDWHSFHVEHHIFPGINFDYYPQVSEAIQEKFPEKYDRINLWKAVRECYSEDVLVDDPLI